MRRFAPFGLIASIALAQATIASAQAPKASQADPKAATKATTPARPAILDQVLATVNGESITRDELYRILQISGTPPGASIDEDQSIYQMTIEQIINLDLLKQYLKKQAALVVTEKEIDAVFAEYAAELKKDGQDVFVALASNGLTVAKVREDMAARLRFRKYIEAVATDENLEKYVAENKDIFNRTQVKASHIVLLLGVNATAADKEKAKAKLLAIKQEIESKKITFADAANKYSEDDSNKTSPRGGDLGYFQRKGQFIEPFSAAAFGMKVGAISSPIETPFGMHLITVTDRKDGTPVDFKQNKLAIRDAYASDLHDRIIASERKTAKIKIEPMPADFFPKNPTPPAGATPAGAAPAGANPTNTGKAATPK